jgi:hypothetical protein
MFLCGMRHVSDQDLFQHHGCWRPSGRIYRPSPQSRSHPIGGHVHRLVRAPHTRQVHQSHASLFGKVVGLRREPVDEQIGQEQR